MCIRDRLEGLGPLGRRGVAVGVGGDGGVGEEAESGVDFGVVSFEVAGVKVARLGVVAGAAGMEAKVEQGDVGGGV